MLQCYWDFASAFGFQVRKFGIVAGKYEDVTNEVDCSKVLILDIREDMRTVKDALDLKFLGIKASDSDREAYRISHLPNVMFLALNRAQVRLSFSTGSS